jgi:hypothetical protein
MDEAVAAAVWSGHRTMFSLSESYNACEMFPSLGSFEDEDGVLDVKDITNKTSNTSYDYEIAEKALCFHVDPPFRRPWLRT